jgi:SecD/SecF fusion protein
MTRYFFAGWVQNPNNKSLTMRDVIGKTNIAFLQKAKTAMAFSALVIAVGGALFFTQWHTIFGMDFTGGYSLIVEMEENDQINYRTDVHDALVANGASQVDVQVKKLNKDNQLRIQLGRGMEEEGAPFAGMHKQNEAVSAQYPYQNNPRLTWVVDSMEQAGLNVKETQLETLDHNWSVMSGQFSDAMRNNAIMAMGIALLCILLYITIRFEFKYAIAAIVALTHDVAITIALVALFHKFGMPIQIDLEAIGAIMTIIGYSLNDTIIIFDRIREDIRLMRKMSFPEIINHALNVTLSRTILTSSTTLLVLLALVLLGGSSIFGFALIMTLGVAFGTLSSLFIASPVMLYFHNKEVEKEEEMRLKKA